METRILNLMYKKIYQIVAKYNGKIIYEQSQSKRTFILIFLGLRVQAQNTAILRGYRA